MDAQEIRVVNDVESAVNIIRHVGAWMRDNKTDNYSAWWDPDRVTVNMLSKYAQPNEFYVVLVDKQPAATAIIQFNQTMQDWSSVDKNEPAVHALYIHYMAVERQFAGQGLVSILLDKAEEIAQQGHARVIRLDTDAKEPKLCQLYESLGFQRVGTEQEGDHTTAFYEKQVLR